MQRADPASFRMAASRFATGVTVITALDAAGEICGMTANSFVTVSLSPPTVLFLAIPGRTHTAISATGRYAVNVLPERAAALSAHFAGRPDPTSIFAISGPMDCRGWRIAWRSSRATWSGRLRWATTPCSSPRSLAATTATAIRWCSSAAGITMDQAGRPRLPRCPHKRALSSWGADAQPGPKGPVCHSGA